jgi:hypothetical protein
MDVGVFFFVKIGEGLNDGLGLLGSGGIAKIAFAAASCRLTRI